VSARGECRLGTHWWREAITLCEAITDRSRYEAFIVDPEAGIRANSIRTLHERGLFGEARTQCERALAIAGKLGQPLGLSLAHWRAGMLEIRLRNVDRVLEHSSRLEDIVARTQVQQADGPSRYLRGWALAHQGKWREGLELIRDGLERHLRIGMIASSTEVMGYAAEALICAGEWEAANRELALAFARARELDEHYYVAALMMLQARVARGQGDRAGACRWLKEAVRIARRQEAAGFELEAATALVEHPDATDEDREALRALARSLPEAAPAAGLETRPFPDRSQTTS
jgi:tetratricopeptide (TPR) repeat protein